MSNDNKSLTRRFYEEVFNQRKVDAIDELCDPSFTDHTAMPGMDAGIAGTKQMFSMFMGGFSDLKLTLDELVGEGDTVVARFTLHATHDGPLMGAPATGKSVVMHGVDVVHLKNGRATDVWHYGDDMVVMAQLGVKPPV